MKLASILNSGESLEKAVVLATLAWHRNADFYRAFDEVLVFYTHNLPRRHSTEPVHGTIGAILHHMGGLSRIGHRTIDDLWDDRWSLTERIFSMGGLSRRTLERLLCDKIAFCAVLPLCPWYSIYPKAFEYLIRRANLVGNVTPVSLDTARLCLSSLRTIHARPAIAKLYALFPDGGIGCRAFGGLLESEGRRLAAFLRSAITCSPNVYLFTRMINDYCNREQIEVFGYRPFTRFPRRAYDAAVEDVLRNRHAAKCAITIEPRNERFSDILKSLSVCHSTDERTTVAIYVALKELWQ
jgi:hypothetical protein